MGENIDLNAGTIIEGKESIDNVGKEFLEKSWMFVLGN